MDKEWQKLWAKGIWDVKTVREKDEVIKEARAQGRVCAFWQGDAAMLHQK